MKPVSFFTILKSEHYKLRFNIAIWLFLLFPFFITLYIDVYILFKHADAVNNPAITFDYNPWVWLLGRYIFEFYSLLYPILAAVLSYSLCDVEYKNYGFRLLFTRPVSKVTVYSSKIVFLLEIIFISSLIGYLTFLLSGFALDKLLPGYKFSSYNVNTLMASYFSYLFIALSAVSFIQYNLSLIFKSFVLPIGFASLMTIFTRWRNKIKSINIDKKLHMSLIFSNLVAVNQLSLNHRMYNLYTKFVKILEICKQFSQNLVNECGNIPRRGPVPKFSDLEVVALSLTAEAESIDSEKWLFDYRLQEHKSNFPNLISRRQFNDRRKKTAGLCEEIRKRIAMEMDGEEGQFFVDSKPIGVCRVARGKRCKMGRTGDFSQAPDFGYCASQNTYYFGYKLHALCGLTGVIHSYDLSKASIPDLDYMKDVKLSYHDCSIYGDKGYIGADVQLDLFETAHIRLECPYRVNQKDWKPTFIPLAKARKRIETLFSQLTEQFLTIRNYAKITSGLYARIIAKISALTILQYVNFINNKPIGRIKYALN